IWSEVGHDTALKKVVHAKSENGKLKISFPNLASGQAIISAIAIATKDITVKPAKPSPKNILDVSATVAFELGSWLDTNSKQYLNANVQFNKLPSELFGADYIRFSNSAKTDVSGSFISKENATVYVILDSKINETWPWLIGLEKLPDTIQNSKGNQFQLLKKQVKKGEKVTFGPQGHQENKNMFSIVVVPVYVMGEEQEERTVLKLEAEIAKTTGTGIKKAFFKGSDYIEFTENTKNSITFTVNPGVANIYLMRYRFMNLHTAPIKVRLTIEDANGTLLKNDEIEFPMAHEKWRILNTTTGGYINAGTYKIALEPHPMKGLRLESFEFQ
ncbi:MAG TPA: glycoside hydrolase family 2, partial [Mariniflexile sp.]|nr:glycoside hydrolase family 2 [Mariniflexile sp.]